jgi:hypothetical protein
MRGNAGLFGITGAVLNRPKNHFENGPVWLGVIEGFFFRSKF